ncbi:outer membrane exchange protein TraA family protein [Polyangium aurulentum]|uniref:outer membrane exchange protein TraA family protein n=1 Tax=Polyangium aurulentum TaxID=2567896 RepID=UPI001F3AD069|nr:outer membrane exchange protein TraA family protein [Polyangium aurulentum]
MVIPAAVGAPIEGEGTGLCEATANTTAAAAQSDFQLFNPSGFTGAVDVFLDTTHKMDRVERVVRTMLDLSNNNAAGLKLSYGDFIDAALQQGCKTGGCDFVVNDTSTAFGSRFRGFLNVTDELAKKPIHIGFYTDDAVALTIYGGSPVAAYSVIFRPAQFGVPTYRVTNTVTFQEAGLYPVEIHYIELQEHAALEMSYLEPANDDGSFTDFERPANEPPIVQLDDAKFTVFKETQFFHTIAGIPSYPDLKACKQCDRQFANKPGQPHGCGDGYYCNEAALCSPCDTAASCGPTCSPCGMAMPYCLNVNGTLQCAACKDDLDCKDGFTCDPVTHTCNECNVDSDCPKGDACVDHKCEYCDTSDSCAGNSCNCCPPGDNGKTMMCAPLGGEETPSCVECVADKDCTTGICDVQIGRCVPQVQPNQAPSCCGEACVNCATVEGGQKKPNGHPLYEFCLPGPVGTACAQCRNDMDCGEEGKFCLSGECVPCTRDKRCGERCESCGGDTPFCNGQTAATATCVRCISDDQCNGSTCNKQTHQCEPNGCAMSCAEDKPYCNGAACVECYADAQCPCGGTCDLTTNKCSPSCKTNVDCLGNEHCRWTEDEIAKECALGPMPDGADCGGTLATICSASPGRHGGGAPASAFLALSILALLGRRRGRGQS